MGIQSRPEERGSPGAEKVIARSGPAIWASALPFSTRRSLLPQLRTRSEAHRGRRLLSKTMLARQALSSSRQFSSRASKICEPRSLGRLTRRRFLTAPLAFPHRRQGSALQANPPPTVTDMGCSRLCREPLGPRGRCNRSCAGSLADEAQLSCDVLLCASEHQNKHHTLPANLSLGSLAVFQRRHKDVGYTSSKTSAASARWTCWVLQAFENNANARFVPDWVPKRTN